MLLVVLHHRGQGKDHQFGITLAGVVRDMKNVYIIWLIRGLDKGAKLTGSQRSAIIF